jgi:hypothetical protein
MFRRLCPRQQQYCIDARAHTCSHSYATFISTTVNF